MKVSAAFGAVLWLVTMCMVGAPRARSEPARTALVLAPRGDEPALVEVTARVRGELAAAGFRVLTRAAPIGLSAERAVALSGQDLAPSAVLWIVAASGHSASTPALEIWLSDRLLGKVSMARLSAARTEGDMPKVLAVQAVELLRARMSELRVDDAEEALAAESAADAWVEQPAPEAEPAKQSDARADVANAQEVRERPWFGLSLGFGYLLGSGSLSGAPMPTLGLQLGLGEPRADATPLSCDLSLNAGGFSGRERVHEENGSVQLDHAFGEFRAALRVVPRFPIEPFAALGVGVYTLGVRGSASPPFQAHQERYWAPTGSVSLGLRSRPLAHLSLVLAGELLQAFSRADVRVADALAARAGGTMWLLRAELMGVF
jgi:hypothetical protein